MTKFGKILRKLRSETGVGIKRLAPELGVSYTYLSKLENNELSPSEDLVTRIATYFKCDRNSLLLSAGRIPPEVVKILQEHPEEAVELLKRRFGNPNGR
jgi:HTH-type transcriptional regulator, competence development regulator